MCQSYSSQSVCENSGGSPCQGCVSCAPGWTMIIGRCYFLELSTAIPYANAVSDCQARGAKLFEPKSRTINDAVANLMGGNRFWIGLTDLASEGNFVYESNGQSPSYTYWLTLGSTPQPDNANNNENCVHVRPDDNHGWNDINCGYSYRYVCEGLVYDNP